VSVARIYGSGRRSSSLDCLTSAQTQILPIAAGNDLHTHRSLTYEPRGSASAGKPSVGVARNRNCDSHIR
jgi:hypothetical protein